MSSLIKRIKISFRSLQGNILKSTHYILNKIKTSIKLDLSAMLSFDITFLLQTLS